MSALLAQALEQTCREDSIAACALRFSLPLLPGEPILPDEGEGG
jgi:hypothetical protein